MIKIDHPDYYRQPETGIECITIAEHWDFNLGNALKYLWRAGLKNSDPIEDMRKAVWYIQREIERIQRFKSVDPDSGIEEEGRLLGVISIQGKD